MLEKEIKGLLKKEKNDPMLDFISEDPEAKELINKILQPTRNPFYIQRYKTTTRGPTPGVRKILLNIRNSKIILLAELGWVPKSILSAINKLSYTEGRGRIDDERSIRRILGKYYIDRKPSLNETEGYKDAIIESVFALQDKLIENLSLLVAKPIEEWESPLEYALTVWKLICLHQHRINSNGRNLTKKKKAIYLTYNPMALITKETDSEVSEVINVRQKKVQELIKKIDEALEKE